MIGVAGCCVYNVYWSLLPAVNNKDLTNGAESTHQGRLATTNCVLSQKSLYVGVTKMHINARAESLSRSLGEAGHQKSEGVRQRIKKRWS